MLNVKIAKWHNNADSPVMFMIDDFCNKWIDLNENGKVDLGEDWGYGKDIPNSSFNFLKTELLEKYPYLKVTFFTTVGTRNPAIERPLYKIYSAPINEDEKSEAFFRKIHSDKRFEIAYHGLNHGIPGRTIQDFRQEWMTFRSIKEAVKQTEQGKKIYFETFGEYPRGGKYCGYEYNDFADKSISKANFFWWCRDWSRGKTHVADKIRFEPKYFGVNKVIDIPSTVGGYLLTGRNNMGRMRRTIKRILKPMWIEYKLKTIASLLKNKQIISIQEHIAPSIANGQRQVPNIFDDRKSLRHIFTFLKNKNVWYATGTEIAEYFDARENAEILKIKKDKFRVEYTGRPLKPTLTLIIKTNRILKENRVEIIAPDGTAFKGCVCKNSCYKINLRIVNGIYRINEL